MKVLITGGHGQVGHESLRQAREKGWQAEATGRDRLDISDAATVRAMIKAYAPDAVINAAAYTAVDKAESEADQAYAVNRDGPLNLAVICAEMGIPLVHYSTDCVFDGAKAGAYVEEDPPGPLGVYGASKLAGEVAVRGACAKHLILRTSWVFSAYGHNFVKTMLRLGRAGKALRVVSDQYGKPTSAAELVRLTLEVLPKAAGHWGTYHVAQPDVINWHGFAETIFAEACRQNMVASVPVVEPIATSEYPTPARRPLNSALNCACFESIFGVSIRPWRASLAQVIGGLKDA